MASIVQLPHHKRDGRPRYRVRIIRRDGRTIVHQELRTFYDRESAEAFAAPSDAAVPMAKKGYEAGRVDAEERKVGQEAEAESGKAGASVA